MDDSIKLEHLLYQAKSGDEQAAAELYEKLAVRFAVLIAKELQRHAIVRNAIRMNEATADICQQAIQKIKQLCPLNSPQWSFQRATRVLHNLVDDFIMNTLAQMAQKGDQEAEELLFRMLRPKLMEHVNKKRDDRD